MTRNERRATPEYKAKAAETSRIWRAKPEVKARAREASRRYYAKPGVRERMRERHNTPEGRERQREYMRKCNYGLQRGEWDAMFEKQEKSCKICYSKTHGSKGWHTDHCHSTGKVRGILCHACNVMIGAARDRAEILTAGAIYLGR